MICRPRVPGGGAIPLWMGPSCNKRSLALSIFSVSCLYDVVCGIYPHRNNIHTDVGYVKEEENTWVRTNSVAYLDILALE